jgi:cytochrome c biogenesis protein CcmG/thiol:disulfide interchange protein DsbE
MKKSILMYLTIGLLASSVLGQNKKATDFTLPDMDGKNFRLSENLGKGPVLINFWATWCGPCKAEMKKLKKIFKKYKEDGLQILSISIDDPKTVNRVKGDVKINRYPFKILLDTNSEVFHLYGGVNPPHSILINNEGQIVYTHTGYRKGDEIELEKKIAALIETEKAKK